MKTRLYYYNNIIIGKLSISGSATIYCWILQYIYCNILRRYCNISSKTNILILATRSQYRSNILEKYCFWNYPVYCVKDGYFVYKRMQITSNKKKTIRNFRACNALHASDSLLLPSLISSGENVMREKNKWVGRDLLGNSFVLNTLSKSWIL